MREGLRFPSIQDAFIGGLRFIAIGALAHAFYESEFYTPQVVGRASVTVDQGKSRVTAAVRLQVRL